MNTFIIGKAKVPYSDATVKQARVDAERAVSTQEQYLLDNFASIVGSLIYIAITCRPDIVYCVNQMAKGMHKPQLHHVVAMTQCLRYRFTDTAREISIADYADRHLTALCDTIRSSRWFVHPWDRDRYNQEVSARRPTRVSKTEVDDTEVSNKWSTRI